MERGHFGIGYYNPKFDVNAGTLIRSASAFGADYVFTISDRYGGEPSAVGHDRHIPIFQYDTIDEWIDNLPRDTTPVAIELDDNAVPLEKYNHPERASYLLGPEDGDIPEQIINQYQTVKIPSDYCLNVATAGSVVLYDRVGKTNIDYPKIG